MGVWGLPSHLLRLRDGRLLMTYGYRRAPFGNQARDHERDEVARPRTELDLQPSLQVGASPGGAAKLRDVEIDVI